MRREWRRQLTVQQCLKATRMATPEARKEASPRALWAATTTTRATTRTRAGRTTRTARTTSTATTAQATMTTPPPAWTTTPRRMTTCRTRMPRRIAILPTIRCRLTRRQSGCARSSLPRRGKCATSSRSGGIWRKQWSTTTAPRDSLSLCGTSATTSSRGASTRTRFAPTSRPSRKGAGAGAWTSASGRASESPITRRCFSPTARHAGTDRCAL
mmetsp:Transcript_37046/g.79012  ORF Transcript_37046/g.79012 Transcript_37046/m.79012 type:complete len:214 (+) Transcript_37046:407-1048(+)